MPSKQMMAEGVWDTDLRGPRDMVKAELLEPYVPSDVILRLPLTTPSMRGHQRYADEHEVG
jgi:hypothetical protein